MVDWKRMIRRALLVKQRAGLGDYKAPQPKQSKRAKTREFWRTHPDVKPWPLRSKPTPHPFAGKTNFSKEAKKERRNSSE